MSASNREDEVSRQTASLKQMVEHSAQLADQASTANLAKTRFLANVSHELRTPLNAIMGFMELLANSDLNSTQRHYVELSRDAASALLNLIEDLLDSGRIEAGYLELKPKEFQVQRLIRTVLAMHQPLAERKGLYLRSRIDSQVAEWWFGDEGRIRQVLSNLVHNALKFTESGGVDVEVSLAEGCGLRFEVRDTGIGLKPEDCSRIFEAFTQLDEGSSRHYGGTGLGLSICRQLVQLMGGEIHVISQPGQGSIFWTELSLEPTNPPATDESSVIQSSPARLHGRVLVVEDNPLNQALLSEMLKSLGCQVEVVADGEEALKRWRARPFELILMDCQLPGMDGYQIATQIKQQGIVLERAIPPIVALTADVSVGIRERCQQAGMLACLHKPVTVQDLYACLQTWLGNRPAQTASGGQVLGRQTHALFNATAWQQLEKLSGNRDRQLLPKVLSLFRDQGRQCLQTLAQAVAGGDEDSITRLAHSFRSSCVHIGAEELAQWLLCLENSPRQADASLLALLRAGFRRVCCLVGAESMGGGSAS